MSIIIPPIIAALNNEILNINKKIPFPNSGDSLIEEVTQYWTIVQLDPSNIPKNIKITNAKIGTLTKSPKMNMMPIKINGNRNTVLLEFL